MSSNKFKANIKVKTVIWSLIVFFTLILGGICIYGAILLQDSISDKSVVTVIHVIISISAFISGLFAGIINKNKGIYIGSINSLIQIFMLIIIGMIINGTSGIFDTVNIIKMLLIFIFNIMGSIIGVNIKKKY